MNPALAAALRYRGLYMIELLIGHQVQKGVDISRMHIESIMHSHRGVDTTVLCVDDKPVITRYTTMIYLEDARRA